MRCSWQEETQQRMVFTSVHLHDRQPQHDPVFARLFMGERSRYSPTQQQNSCGPTAPFNHLQYSADEKLRTSSSRSVGEGVNAIGPVIPPVNNQPCSCFPSVPPLCHLSGSKHGCDGGSGSTCRFCRLSDVKEMLVLRCGEAAPHRAPCAPERFNSAAWWHQRERTAEGSVSRAGPPLSPLGEGQLGADLP